MPAPLTTLILDVLQASAVALAKLEGRPVLIEVAEISVCHPASALGACLDCRRAWQRIMISGRIFGNLIQVRNALQGAMAAFTTLHGVTFQVHGTSMRSDQSRNIARCAGALDALLEAYREEATWG